MCVGAACLYAWTVLNVLLQVSVAVHYWIGGLEKSGRPSAADENCLIKAFRRTKKKEKSRDTFSSAACLNRLRSAEHNPELRN